MNVYTRSSFDRALTGFSDEDQKLVLDAALRLPSSFGRAHEHSGLGIRKIGRYFEFRIGLRLRVLFLVVKGDAVLLTVGDHDEISRFVRENS